MDKLWSPIVGRLQPYVPGEQPRDQQHIKLNTNENPYPPSPEVLKAIERSTGEALRLYPDPEAKALKQSIAAEYQLQQNQVFVGNGSDEVLAFSFMAFFTGKGVLQFPGITYSFYPVYCNLFSIEYETLPLREDFVLRLEDFSDRASGIIFANPNAPTGRAISRSAVETLLKRIPDAVVIVDEAYVDFGGESSTGLIDLYPNLLVIQTFSKSRSLAGMRLGYAMGHASLIDALNRVKDSFNSYPVDRLAQIAGAAAMQDRNYFERMRNKVIDSRERVGRGLSDLGFDVIPSRTNFVFARHPEIAGDLLHQSLKSSGILVRHFRSPDIDQYLRISIGTDEEMGILLERLPRVMKSLQP